MGIIALLANLALACPAALTPAGECPQPYILDRGGPTKIVAVPNPATPNGQPALWKAWEAVAEGDPVRVCPEGEVGAQCVGNRSTVAKEQVTQDAAPPVNTGPTRKVRVEWDHALVYTDGSPITDRWGYRIEWRPENGEYAKVSVGWNISFLEVVVPVGRVCFRGITLTANHGESAPSEEVCTGIEDSRRPAAITVIRINVL